MRNELFVPALELLTLKRSHKSKPSFVKETQNFQPFKHVQEMLCDRTLSIVPLNDANKSDVDMAPYHKAQVILAKCFSLKLK